MSKRVQQSSALITCPTWEVENLARDPVIIEITEPLRLKKMSKIIE